MKWIKKIYDWTLHWADSRYAVLALFLLSFSESSFFPVPPDVLLIAMALGKPKKAFTFALLCSIASVLGGMFGYGIGSFLWYTGDDYSALAKVFFDYVPGFSVDKFSYVKGLYVDYSFWVVFTAGFTPIPYKIITITAGVCEINFMIFLVASAISRSARFFLVAGLIWFFGEKIKKFIDKYFNLLTLAFTILLVAGFILIKVFVGTH